MLVPSEFSVGCISDAGAGMTLLLPRGQYQHRFLLTTTPGTLTAIFLDGDHRFNAFETEANTSWHGILIPNVRIEVDETSVVDLDAYEAPLGTLLREKTQLTIVVRAKNVYSSHRQVPILGELPATREGFRAGFAKWSVVLGEGTSRRELAKMDVTAKKVER
jgi:hypothetical protein